MTVAELIGTWTEEERQKHAALIAECLEREKFLLGIRRDLRAAEKRMDRNIDVLLTSLSELAQAVNEKRDQVQTLYLLLAKGKGNA